MNCPSPTGKLFGFVLLLNRLSLGGLLLWAGINKVFYQGVSEFYRTSFVAMKPVWLPDWFAAPYGHAVPFLELIVGALLIAGFVGRFAGLVAALMISSFSIALIGAGHFMPNGVTNLVLITVALLLAVTGSGMFSLDTCICRGGKGGGQKSK